MPTNDDVQGQTDRELVDWALDIEEGLTDWEVNFIESLDSYLKDQRPLSTREGGQRDILEKIIKKKG